VFVDFWADIRSAGLFSDFGFGPRMALSSEIWDRLRLRVLPATPDTRELAELFPLLFQPQDLRWLAAIDPTTLQRLGMPAWRGVADGPDPWREEMMDAVTYLVSAVRAAGFSAPLQPHQPGALANALQVVAVVEKNPQLCVVGQLTSPAAASLKAATLSGMVSAQKTENAPPLEKPAV